MSLDSNEYGEFQDLGSLHHYRTELPNVIFYMSLPTYEFKAYCVFKWTAGDNGACFKSNATLCEEIGCSMPKLIEIKEYLQKKQLIVITKRKASNGGNMPDLIQIVDMWAYNMQEIPKKNKLRKEEGSKRRLPGGVNDVYQGGKRRLVKQEQKEEELKKTTTKESEEPVLGNDVSPSAVVFSQQEKQSTERPKKVTLPSKAKIAKREYSAPEPFYAKPKKDPEPIPEQFELFVPLPEASVKPNAIPKFLADFEIDPDPAIDLTEKRQILARYTHETIQNAILWVIANLSKMTTTKVQYLKFACEKGLIVKESKVKLSHLEELQLHFEHYAKYNGATCYLNAKCICFERGTRNELLELNNFFSFEKFTVLCAGFGIEFTRDGKHNKHRDPQ